MLRRIIPAALAIFLVACASPQSLKPGTPIAEARSTLGRPTAEITLPDGGSRLQYSGQPNNQLVWEATLTSAIELAPGHFVVGGMAGTLLWSDGAGPTVRKQELPGRKAIMAAARVDDGNLLLFGEGGIQRVEIPR